MNCRESLRLICAERDAPLASGTRSRLEVHLTACATCRQARSNLTAALESWRRRAASGKLPDAQHEWLAVRRKIRGGDQPETTTARSPWRVTLGWLALPLVTALLAVALFLPRPPPIETTGRLSPAMARADSVEVPGKGVSTMVFVDDQSGWLIVWANDAGGQSS